MAIPNKTAASGGEFSLDRLVAYLQGAINIVNGFLGSFDRLAEAGFPQLIELDLTDAIQRSPHYTLVVASRQRKSLIGQKAFKHLLHTFVSGDVDAPREWSGQLILELVRKSKDNGSLMHIVQSINTGTWSIGYRNCSIGILVSRILTIMITEDNRFRFMKIRLDHIDKLVQHAGAAVLDVYLYDNGVYMTNGLTEKADKVSMVFENQIQGIGVRDVLEQQCRSVKGAMGRFMGAGGVSKVADRRISPESFLCTTGVVKDSITLDPNLGKSTAQNRKKRPSFAAIMLSFDEEAIRGSSVHFDLNASHSQNERDQESPPMRGKQLPNNNVDCLGLVDSWRSYPSKVDEIPEPGYPPGSSPYDRQGNPSPQTTPSIVNLPNGQDRSFNGNGVVEPQISQEGGDTQPVLPSLARQALRLRLEPYNSNSLTNSVGQHDQGVESGLDLGGLVTEKTSTVDDPTAGPQRPADILVDKNPNPVNPTTMGQQINVPQKHVSGSHNEVDVPNQIAGNPKLKRPHNRISISKANPLTVDWDQDLRVEDNLLGLPASSSKKLKGTPPQSQGPTKTSKLKSASCSTKKKNKKLAQTLPLTLHEARTSAKSKTKKTSCQVTKTLTSARQRRAAAEKANRKLALANEYENATYDLDDPIESSPPEDSILVANRDNWTGSTDAASPGVTSEDVQVQPMHSIEGVVDLKPNPAMPETSNPVEIVGSEQTANNKETGHSDFLVGRVADHELDLQGSNVPGREAGTSTQPNEVGNSETLSGVDIPQWKTVGECGESNWGKRLSKALAKAGMLSSNSLIDCKNVDGESNNNLIDGTGCQLGNNASEISKNVSQFIARQAVEHDKLGHSGVRAVENTEGSIKPNDGTYQSVQAGSQPEKHPTKPRVQNQLTAATELDSIPKPNNNGRNKVEGNKNDELLTMARALRKVQVVGFDSRGPKNQCAISDGAAGRNSTKFDTIINDTHEKEEVYLGGKCSENCANDIVDEFDDLDEVSLIPTSDCRRLVIDNQHSDVGSYVDSISICEVTHVEFRPQGRDVQPIPTQSQRVDENGSPQPLHRYLHANRLTSSNIPPGVELPIEISGTSQLSEASVSLSEEEVRIAHRMSPCSVPAGTYVDPIRAQDLSVSNESSLNSKSETSSQRRDKPPNQKDLKTRSIFAIQDQPSPRASSFWRRSAPSTFAKHLRGQQKTNRKNKSQKNKKTRRQVLRIKKASRKSNAMPFAESSSELDHDINSLEDEVYDTRSSNWDSVETSSGSNSNLSDTLVEECRDVESEWQNALRATQKTSLDILLEISGRLIRHLVDEEQAIIKVVDTYRKGGATLIQQLEQRYGEQLVECENRLQPIKEELIERYDTMMTRLNSDRQSLLKQPPMRDLSAAVHKRKRVLVQIDAVMKAYETDA
ncbi:conserved hypothetical protein [Histoplasma capsulatum var. duboisii H88]|uniref:PH-like domain-containing protein n=2 Tax=Ajellomyces capsulatus (strain H88) TaxID=544711 RepID=F0UTD2_AJEC8|nr:conserved hypothetical protein [Histoplasma capsulatum var. duboisii H88]